VLEVDQLRLRTHSSQLIASVAGHVGFDLTDKRLDELAEFSCAQVEDSLTDCLGLSEYLTIEKSGLTPDVANMLVSRTGEICTRRGIVI
jgi:hypothetical protein